MNGFSGEGSPITFFRHEISAFAELIAARLDGSIRAIIREELQMTDQAILDLTASVDAAVAAMGSAVTEMQSEANALAAALAANGTTNDPAIEAQVLRLQAATKTVADAVKALQLTPPPASPAPSPAPSPVASPAPSPAPTGATGPTSAAPAPVDGGTGAAPAPAVPPVGTGTSQPAPGASGPTA